MASPVSCDHVEFDGKQCYAFMLLLSGFDEITDVIENALFEAGCDDATLGIHAGNPYLTFHREAKSLEEAIRSALRQVKAANVGIEVVRVVLPGEDTIDMFNSHLKLRRQLLSSMPEELAERLGPRIDDVIVGLVEKNPELLKHAFGADQP